MVEPEPLQQVDRVYVRCQGRKFLYFSGCDYFKLASHARVITALQQGAARFGLNVAASRLTTGNHALYQRLEGELADFFAAPEALLVPTGYVSNLVVAQALAGKFSHALIDERAHPSLWDAARMLDCPRLQFRHRDAEHLASSLKRCGVASRPCLLTDGLFARDGSTAPLEDYLRVLPADAVVVVDDAHGAGVLGAHGRGTLEHCGVGRRRIIQTVTLSKAFGAYGGAILVPSSRYRAVLQQSPLFIGSTPLPLPLAAAVLESLAVFRTECGVLQQRLAENMSYLRNKLRAVGLAVPDSPGPILALAPKTPAAARRLRNELLRAGIYPPFIRYPGGPPAGYFRFVISSAHTLAQLDHLLRALGAVHVRLDGPGSIRA